MTRRQMDYLEIGMSMLFITAVYLWLLSLGVPQW